MKHKVCLLFTFLSLSVSGISATNGQDSIRQIQLSDLEVQIRWVNPTAIRAYLDDTKTALGGKAPALYEKLSRRFDAEHPDVCYLYIRVFALPTSGC